MVPELTTEAARASWGQDMGRHPLGQDQQQHFDNLLLPIQKGGSLLNPLDWWKIYP